MFKAQAMAITLLTPKLNKKLFEERLRASTSQICLNLSLHAYLRPQKS